MTILSIRKICKNFGGIKALDNCNMTIERGNITAIIGPNGSGKTTLFNVISRIIPLDQGKIKLNDVNVTKYPAYKIGKSGISRTFQDVRLFSNLTIKDHLAIATSRCDEGLFYNFFKGCKINLKKIKIALKLVGLNKPLDTLATDLSYGQRKLLDLAIGIAKPHKLLMLDEPVAGVNPALRENIKKILKKLKKVGETIVLIEHDMNFVMDIADYVFVLDAGKVIAHGKPEEIQKNKKVLNAYLGEKK